MMAVWLLSLLGVALGGRPQVVLVPMPDDKLQITLETDTGWEEAELTIAGESYDLGPAKAGATLELDAWATPSASLTITLRAVDAAGHGHTWRFTEDTLGAVPERPPLFQRIAPREWSRRNRKPQTP